MPCAARERASGWKFPAPDTVGVTVYCLLQILNEIAQHKIKIYEFPECDDEEENKVQKRLKVGRPEATKKKKKERKPPPPSLCHSVVRFLALFAGKMC